MAEKSMIDEAAFERMLRWLNPDREKAAQKYEEIRRRLIEIFASRRFPDADCLADDTIDRVILRVEKVADGWVGDPAYFFWGVARKIILENSKRPSVVLPPPPPPDPDQLEREDQCLERCLELVSKDERKLILEYVDGKKKQRQEQAEKLGVTPNALRIRVCHIKRTIRPCMRDCLEQQAP